METYELSCKKCKYSALVGIGTPNKGQTYSDMNEDFSKFELYRCMCCKEYHAFDSYDRQFTGKCSKCSEVLQKVVEIPPKHCPKCDSVLTAKKKSFKMKESV